MSISQPSNEIYVIDVPEIKLLEATYFYNFFVPNESTDETAGVPSSVLARNADQVDASFIQYSVSRAPRFVQLNFTPPKLADVGNVLSERASRDHAFQTTGEQNGSLILDNLDKVIDEDYFASNNYVSIQFHDGNIDTKIHQMVSGTITQQTLTQETDTNATPYKSALRLVPTLPSYIKPLFIFQAMSLNVSTFGGTFYVPATVNTNPGMTAKSESVRVNNDYFVKLKQVSTNTQINSKFLHDLVNRAIQDPTSTQAGDMVNMHQYSKQAKQATNQRFSSTVSEQDFKTFVPYVAAQKQSTATHVQKYGSEIAGYIIDKFEVLDDGSTRALPPIVLDSPYVGMTADYSVKFNANYCYTIRTIALLTVAAIDDDSGEVATLKVLVSSKPSNKVYVSTLKLDSPPPPSDVNMVWNYETSKLMITWAFPVTSERDIKQFQVFRRSSIDHPFELQKVYNFDDSEVPFDSGEVPDPRLVERLLSPATYWIDDEFQKDVNFSQDKGMIYAVCAVDAHGLTSNYSAQFRVWFDRFKNKLQKELVSHTGAPKPYPNLYLAGEAFKNTINVSGPNSKRMKLFFNPEFYYLFDDQNRYTKVLQTVQDGGGYKLQFINADSLKSIAIDVNIDDQMRHSQEIIRSPAVFAHKRVPQSK